MLARCGEDRLGNEGMRMIVDLDGSREQVKEYYSRTLGSNLDLKTNACCTAGEALPAYLRPILKQIDPEIIEKFYGCGSPIPPLLSGRTVLDLGCGTGRDVYLVSKLVGREGRVIGVDMTESQLEVARRHVESQARRFELPRPNTEFHQGYIEDLSALGIADDSIDVVISNCVLNLSPDKRRVFAEIFRVLKPGGELYFSDIFAGRRVPDELACDPVLRGECLGGAMYIEDFRRLLRDLGCPDYRVVSRRPIVLDDPVMHAKAGMIDFHSMTVRAFKLSGLEDICEDYGQAAVYRGTIAEQPHAFTLDDHHTFSTGKPMLVCGNTAAMLAETRFAEAFESIGDRTTHYGPFDCGVRPAFPDESAHLSGGCC